MAPNATGRWTFRLGMPQPARAPTEVGSRRSSYSLPPGPAILTNLGLGSRSSVGSSRSASEVGADDQHDMPSVWRMGLRSKQPGQPSSGSMVPSQRRPASAGGLRTVAGGLCMIEKIGHELKRLAKVLGDRPSSQPRSGEEVAAQESLSAAAQLRESLNQAQALLQATAKAKEAYSNCISPPQPSSHWQPPADEAWRQLPAPACLGPEEVRSFGSEEFSSVEEAANSQALAAVQLGAMSTGSANLQAGPHASRRGPALPAPPQGPEAQAVPRRGLPEPPLINPCMPRPGQLWYASTHGHEPVTGESTASSSVARVTAGKIRRAGSTPATSTTATMSSGCLDMQSFSFATDLSCPFAHVEQGCSTRDKMQGGNLDSLLSDAYAVERQSQPRAQQPAKNQTLLETEPKLSLWELEERDAWTRGKETQRPSPRSKATPSLDIGLGTRPKHRKNLGQRRSPESQRSKFEVWPSACSSSSSTRFEPTLREEPAAAAPELQNDVHSLTSPRFPSRKVARSTSNVRKMYMGAEPPSQGPQPLTDIDEASVPMPRFVKQPTQDVRAHETPAESFASSLAAPLKVTAEGQQACSADVVEELLKAASGAPGSLEAALASVAKRSSQASPSRSQRPASTPEPPWSEVSWAPEAPWSWREDGASTPSSWAGCQPETPRQLAGEEKTLLQQDADRIRKDQHVDHDHDCSQRHAETKHDRHQKHSHHKEQHQYHSRDEVIEDLPPHYRTLTKQESQHNHETNRHKRHQHPGKEPQPHQRDSYDHHHEKRRQEDHRHNHDREECRTADPQQDRESERERRRRRRKSQENGSSVPDSRRSSGFELEEPALQQAETQSPGSTAQSSLSRHRHRKHRHEADVVAGDASASALQQAETQSLASTVQSSLSRHRHRKHRHEADVGADDASVSDRSHRRHRSRRKAEREEERETHADASPPEVQRKHQLSNEAQPGAEAMAQTEAEAQQRRERREARRREREERSKAKHANSDRPAPLSERPTPEMPSKQIAETRRRPKDCASSVSVASSGMTPTTKVPSSPGHYREDGDEAPREEELVRGVERRWQEEIDSIRRQAQKHSKGSEATSSAGRQIPSRYSDLDGCE